MPAPLPATRDRIRSAATTLFHERGYAGASVRDIAAAAGTDPSLVIRHFGSKEQLFLDTVELTAAAEPLLAGPLEGLGRRFVQVLLEADDTTRSAYLALVRGSHEPGIAARLTAAHAEAFTAPLRARLAGPEADLRARLAAAMVGGLLSSLWVVRDAGLLAADPRDVVGRYGDLLQRLITP